MSKMTSLEPSQICVGVISSPLRQVYEISSQRLSEIINQPYRWQLEKVNWANFFENSGKMYDVKRAEIALFSLDSDKTVYTCNLADGWVNLYQSVIKRLNATAYFFRCTLGESSLYRVYEMIFWDCGYVVRHIRALQDDIGWSIVNKGTPLEFENVEQYKSSRIIDRINSDTIRVYSVMTGIDIATVAQFSGPCWHMSREE